MKLRQFFFLASSLPLIASSTIPEDKIENPKIFRSSFALRRIPELSPRNYRSPNIVPVYYGRHKRGGYTSNGGVYSHFNEGSGHRYNDGGGRVRHGSHIHSQNQFHTSKYPGNNYDDHSDERPKPPPYHSYGEKGSGYREGFGDFEKDFGDYGDEGRDYEVVYYKAQTAPDYDDGRGSVHHLPEIVEYEDGRSVILSSDNDDNDETKHVFDEDPGFGGREEEDEVVKISSSPIESFGEFF